jgi:pimeloyl-ACP methyl ester carboxylesterase
VTAARRPFADGLVAVDAGGPGAGVLWFHGYTMDASVFADLWALLPGWRHVGLELPGHGASRPLRHDDDLHTVARAIAAAALEEGIRHLVGLSLGTVLALQVAMERPDDFASLTLAAPGLAGGPHEADVEARYLELATSYRRRGCGPHMTELWMQSPPDVFLHVNRRPALAADLRRVIDRHRWEELEGFGTRALTAPRQEPAAIGRVTASTLLLIGEDELPAHRACAAIIAGALPACEIGMIRGAGHLALLEEPEAAASAIEPHLAAARPPVSR